MWTMEVIQDIHKTLVEGLWCTRNYTKIWIHEDDMVPPFQELTVWLERWKIDEHNMVGSIRQVSTDNKEFRVVLSFGRVTEVLQGLIAELSLEENGELGEGDSRERRLQVEETVQRQGCKKEDWISRALQRVQHTAEEEIAKWRRIGNTYFMRA